MKFVINLKLGTYSVFVTIVGKFLVHSCTLLVIIVHSCNFIIHSGTGASVHAHRQRNYPYKKRPYILCTIPDGPNTLTCQSSAIKYAPRGPLYGPITLNPARTHTKSTLRLFLHSQYICRCHARHNHHHCFNIPLRDTSFIQRRC